MANITINDASLTQLTAGQVATDDIIPVWDTSAGAMKKAARAVAVGANIQGDGAINTGGFTATIPATGTVALTDVAQTFTAKPTLSAGVTGGAQSNVADDAAVSITAPANAGLLVLMPTNLMATGGTIVAWRCQNGSVGQAAVIASGAGNIIETRVDQVLTGTTGTDGKITVSSNPPDGKIYIENRSGGARTFAYFFITN